MMIDIYYCANGNKRFAEIAIAAGFKYGAQLPGTVYFRPEFADQNWKNPDRQRYMAALAEHRPEIATVIDWTEDVPLACVLDWAEEAAQYVEVVIIIPKVQGGISRLPRHIAGKEIRLGYSVPTRYAGTELPIWDFYGWPVHLLGGSPHAQINLARYLNVASADGSMAKKLANQRGHFWTNGNAHFARDKYWPRLVEADEKRWGDDMPYEAFRRSCKNIMTAWQQLMIPV